MKRIIAIAALAASILMVCAPVFAQQITTATNSVTGTAGSTIDITAACPSGTTILSGGYQFDPNNNNFTFSAYTSASAKGVSDGNGGTALEYSFGSTQIFVPAIVIASTLENGNGWRVNGFVNKSMEITVFAYCEVS